VDRRTILAILLIMIVAIVPSILFPPKKPAVKRIAGAADTTRAVSVRDSALPAAPSPPVQAPSTRPAVRPPADSTSGERTVTVETPLYRYSFSTRGARLVGAVLKSYRSFAPRDSVRLAQIIPDSSEFLAYRVVIGLDTVSLAEWNFEPSTTHLDVQGGANEIAWTGRRGDAAVTLRYRFSPDNYLFSVAGDLDGLARSGLLLVGLGPRIRMVEGDSASDYGAYAVVTKSRSTEKVNFRSLDSAQRKDFDGPFEWAAMKSKYFLTAVLTIDEGATRLGGVTVVGGPRRGKLETNVHTTATLPAPGGKFNFSVYSGPQEYRRLTRVGHDLNDVNPYGFSIFRLIIQPVSVAVMSILLWMHEHLHLAYGLVIIVFGVAVRLALWPLNQKAMRSGMAMQAIQPEMKALQERYKKDPQKQQQEIMKLYREHGVNPLGGCLPMLIPMPVLLAVWFVLANTIEFRGVPFLWLPDLARADPFYIIPVVSGLLMVVVSKIGQMGMPPNPQAATMTYMMPVMFTFLFLNVASGVSLYYGVQNLASLPQQWLIAKERLRRNPPKPANPPGS
jgi:YidC/Oxa1 family membrane protein insertase